MKTYDEDSLFDTLVFFDLDVGQINDYFRYHNVDKVLENINSGKTTVEDEYKNICEWLGIEPVLENTIMDDKATFKDYLKESGFDLREYIEEVHTALLRLGKKYDKADLYFEEDIERYFNMGIPVNKCASKIAVLYDSEFGMKGNRQYEIPDEYDEISESTEKQEDNDTDTESYKDWKLKVFKYLDKRVDVDKVKELSKYIKDFIKQEYDSGEPSWFNAAESVVNYVRSNYAKCLKNTASDINTSEK